MRSQLDQLRHLIVPTPSSLMFHFTPTEPLFLLTAHFSQTGIDIVPSLDEVKLGSIRSLCCPNIHFHDQGYLARIELEHVVLILTNKGDSPIEFHESKI